MPQISTAISLLSSCLQTAQLDPPLREVGTATDLPRPAYPHAVISVVEETFEPATAEAAALVTISLGCSAGRLDDAQAAVRSLAHQVRRALYASSGLSGAVRQLRVVRLRFGGEQDPAAVQPVVSRAELLLELKYCEPQL